MAGGTFRGGEISRYDTLTVCLGMMEEARRMVSRGGRGVDWEAGCESAFEVFRKHEENLRGIMARLRGWETLEKEVLEQNRKGVRADEEGGRSFRVQAEG